MERMEHAGGGLSTMVDPVSLVRQYVKRDANGERLGPNPWFESVVTWPQDPGYDSLTVIRGYNIEPPKNIQSPAQITVGYEVMGWIDASGFIPQEMREVFTFIVVLTDEGWRIQEPQIDQHILPEIAAAITSLRPEDAALIRELGAHPPPNPD